MPSIALPVSLRGQLLSGVRFDPINLFSSNEVGVWYDPSDLTTLFQDTAGTTPVTAAGQPVALVLDKSKGLVLGPELVTNGTFDANITGWTNAQGGTIAWDASGGIAVTAAADGADANAQTSITTTVGRTYKVTWTVVSAEGGWLFRIRNSTDYNYQSVVATTGTFTAYVVSSAISNTVNLLSTDASKKVVFDNISVKELPGNHATQATTASRPTYGIVPLGGRRNLLTRTEEFENAVWTKGGVTVSVNTDVAPDGTTTADRLIEDTSTGEHRTFQNAIFTSGLNYTFSIYVKPLGRSLVQLTSSSAVIWTATFDVTAGSVTNTVAGTASISAAGNGWFRLSISDTSILTASSNLQVRLVDTGINTVYTGNGTSGILLWGAQLELGSTATAYQRVGTAFDVTEAGVASLSYLSFDGVDDFLVTPTITPGIDKAQVFAGVRKLSDAAIAIVVEHSANINTNNGALSLWNGSQSSGAATYRFVSKGTTLAFAGPGNDYASPITNVLTGIGDISGDVSRLRINGSQVAETLTDQGTGNFLAYPLYIGRRAGTSLPLNGNIFSLIVRFGANLDAGTITSTETWVNGKTGAYA